MTTEFELKYTDLLSRVFHQGEEVEVGEWQSQDVTHRPEMVTKELRHETFHLTIPSTMEQLQAEVKPNLPWAEDHFQERVGGKPLNPPPSEAWWPYRVRGNEDHKDGQKFSHTYPERIWPKHAKSLSLRMAGIRYDYGDLDNVINQLTKNPQTRQAYLPIWFPEDTGSVEGQRVPCTLGYHFLIRQGRADITYYIRSCDLLRHFTDDVYMACRLLQWVVGKLRDNEIQVNASSLIMHISSLHIFRGDYPRVRDMVDKEEEYYGAGI